MYTPEGLIIFLAWVLGVGVIASCFVGYPTVRDKIKDSRWLQSQGRADRDAGLGRLEFRKRWVQKHYDKGYNS